MNRVTVFGLGWRSFLKASSLAVQVLRFRQVATPMCHRLAT